MHNGKLRTAIVLCHVDVGDSHHVMATSSLMITPRLHHNFACSSSTEIPLEATVSQLPLYELDEHSAVLYPLALQEYVVCKINAVIEAFNGRRCVDVQNDAWVNSEGHAVHRASVRLRCKLPFNFRV
jgi:hypothetical protein